MADLDDPHSHEAEEDHHKVAQKNWNKVKSYLSKLRKNRAEREGKTSESLIAILFILLEMPVDITKVFTLLENREKDFDQKTNLFELMKMLIQNSEDSILANEILSAFQLLFKTNKYELKSLTNNYNGLPKNKADHQIHLIKSIIETFVEEISKNHQPLNTKLVALDNLKWIFKGRESEIVQAIDIRRIWESNIKIGCDQALLNSILELIEVLISFCARKIQEQGSTENQDGGLSLKRHVSTIDETSMTNILVKSLSLLITEMSQSISEL